ncbi:Crp/Fnr family transcriptional regulator [Sphingomonas sp. LHG3443-2]|uniref:Crp/Fnr family transcriptional regulator n=1 Tax=Sphingomonas sp. LHG3443-2 TaxID=2804639 RepID=UPI003CF3A3A4
MDIHLKRLRSRFHISDEEEAVIRGLSDREEEFGPDRTVVRAYEEQRDSRVLLSGVTGRHKGLRNGSRQITEVNLPGDPIDLHSFTLKWLDHDIVSFTKVRLARVPHERLWRMMQNQPRLAMIYWFGTNLDGSIHREWELSLGRRQALGRMAHLFCELYERFAVVGLTEGLSFAFPFNQTELGECLGLTAVHVNRTLQQLRERGLCDARDQRVVIHDLPKLQALAEFDPRYLFLGPHPL